MGQRKIRLLIEGYVDKDVGIDIANRGGEQELRVDTWVDVMAMLGEIANEDGLSYANVLEIEK